MFLRDFFKGYEKRGNKRVKTKNKTIAVTGITGHTGKYFLEELKKRKYEGKIKCLVRESSDTKKLDESGLEIEKITGNIENNQSINALLKDADILVHIVNIKYSPKLVKAAKKNNVRRIILVHTTGVYSKYKNASNGYKKVERELEPYLKDDSLDITILQPTMIYGDICDHNISKFIRLVDKLPFIPEVGRGDALIQPVNARDLGKAYYQCAVANNLPQKYYIVSGNTVISLHDMMKMISDNLGKIPHFISINPDIAEMTAKIIRLLSFKKIDLVEKVQRLSENRNYSNENARKDFSYDPEDFNTGLKREVEQYLEAKNAR